MKAILFLAIACMILFSAAPFRAVEMVTSHDTRLPVNGTWISADDLKVGDTFVTPDGKRAVVTGIESVSLANASCYGLLTTSNPSGARENMNGAEKSVHGFERLWHWLCSFFRQ